jgi:hypothetical protein
MATCSSLSFAGTAFAEAEAYVNCVAKALVKVHALVRISTWLPVLMQIQHASQHSTHRPTAFVLQGGTAPSLFRACLSLGHCALQRACRSAQRRPENLVAEARLCVQAIAYAAAEGGCCGSAQADATIVARVKAKFTEVAVCKVTVEAETVGNAVAQAIASGLAISVRVPLTSTRVLVCSISVCPPPVLEPNQEHQRDRYVRTSCLHTKWHSQSAPSRGASAEGLRYSAAVRQVDLKLS